MVLILFGDSISYLKLTSSRVSALFQNYKYYCHVYVININTHVLLFFLYYSVVPFALFWTTGIGLNQYSYYCYLFCLSQFVLSLTFPSSHVSALFLNCDYYCLVYVIDINTNVLILFLYYFVVPSVMFWTMVCFKVISDCRCIDQSVIIYSTK